MNNLQILKKAMLSYVSAVKFVWSEIAYPLSIVGKKFMNLRGYRVYGNSVQDGTPTPETPIEIQSVGDLSTKNLLDIDTINTTAATHFIKYNKTTGIITSNYAVYANGLYFHSNIETLKAGTYTISCEVLYDPISSPYNSTMYMQVSGYDENGTRKVYFKTVSVSDATTWTKKTVTLNVATDIDMSDASSTAIGISIQPAGNAQKYTGLNLQIRNVMIAEGDVNDDYEPYHKYKIPVVARGKNLIPIPTFGTFTQNGVTFTNNKDGSITINGTPTGYATTPAISLPDSSLEVLRNNACVLTGFYKASSSNVSMGIDAYLDSKLVKQYYINTYSTNYIKVDLRGLNFNKVKCIIKRDSNNQLIDNLTVKPFLEVGSTMPTSFEPYIAPVTTNIFLDSPLRKVGAYADYVDFEKQKVVRNVEVLDDTGTKTIDESLGVINPPTEETVNLPALPQFKGTTIYEVGTNIKPSGMEAKYC